MLATLEKPAVATAKLLAATPDSKDPYRYECGAALAVHRDPAHLLTRIHIAVAGVGARRPGIAGRGPGLSRTRVGTGQSSGRNLGSERMQVPILPRALALPPAPLTSYGFLCRVAGCRAQAIQQ
jgi:hypothetical protein